MPLDKTRTPFTLPKLPYAENALEPVISARTLSFHYGKHHAAYVAKLNELVAGTPYESLPLEEIIRKSSKDSKARAIFNNAAQAWNHTFFWHSMTSQAAAPPRKINEALTAGFGGLREFKEAFVKAAVAHFGSGWTWLVRSKDGKLKIASTTNADTPLTQGDVPLLVVDLWEHAYYLDYQNRRPEYVQAWIDRLANWAFAEENL